MAGDADNEQALQDMLASLEDLKASPNHRVMTFTQPTTVELPVGATAIAIVERDGKRLLQWTVTQELATRPLPAAAPPAWARLRWNPLRTLVGWFRWWTRGRAWQVGRLGQCDCGAGDYCATHPDR